MCELLNVMDSKIVQVALNGLDNILKAGELHNTKPNPYAVLIEECYGECKRYVVLERILKHQSCAFFS